MKDLYHNLSVLQVLHPVTTITTRTSTSIDLRGFGSANVICSFGQTFDALSGSVYWTVKLQHSDDNSAFSDVTTADLYNGSASYVIDSSSKDEALYSFGYKGAKRYVRAVCTASGTHSNGTPIAMYGLRGDAGLMPVA